MKNCLEWRNREKSSTFYHFQKKSNLWYFSIVFSKRKVL